MVSVKYLALNTVRILSVGGSSQCRSRSITQFINMEDEKTMTKELGVITDDEKNEIYRLYKRKGALIELVSSVGVKENEELYERVLNDLSEANESMGRWWNSVSEKYSWKYDPSDKWVVDFSRNTVSLMTE